jgi:hypothetical protein
MIMHAFESASSCSCEACTKERLIQTFLPGFTDDGVQYLGGNDNDADDNDSNNNNNNDEYNDDDDDYEDDEDDFQDGFEYFDDNENAHGSSDEDEDLYACDHVKKTKSEILRPLKNHCCSYSDRHRMVSIGSDIRSD